MYIHNLRTDSEACATAVHKDSCFLYLFIYCPNYGFVQHIAIGISLQVFNPSVSSTWAMNTFIWLHIQFSYTIIFSGEVISSSSEAPRKKNVVPLPQLVAPWSWHRSSGFTFGANRSTLRWQYSHLVLPGITYQAGSCIV